MDLVEKAFLKSYVLHKNQVRKMSGVPYFVHLLDAAKYVMYETNDENIISAAFLHDVLEDTSYSESELLSDFGEDVFYLVKFCTEDGNNFDSSEEEQKASWKVRKTKSIAKLENASVDELLVFCADKVSNLLSMREDLINGVDIWSKFHGSRDDVFWYYSEIQKSLASKLESKRIFMIYEDLMNIFKK